MGYLGTPIDTRNQFQSLQGKRFNGDGSTTDFTLDVAPGSTLDIEVFVGNVRQDPNSAYTVSGTTLSFTGAPPTGTNNIYVVHQAKAVGTISVPDSYKSDAQTISGNRTFTGDVGIGAAKDLGTGLHIKTGDSGHGAETHADELVIENNTNGGLTLAMGNSNSATIAFANSNSNEDGKIVYRNTERELRFNTAGVEKMRIDSAGHVTKPNQSAFLAHLGSNQNNVANDTTLNFNTEIFDNNADFNTSTYTFTAPVTGKYFISFGLRLDNVDTASDYVRVRCITSNGNRGGAASIFDPGGLSGDPTYWGLGDSLLCDMDANDTATINFAYNSGSQQVDFPADNPEQTHFSAFLVC